MFGGLLATEKIPFDQVLSLWKQQFEKFSEHIKGKCTPYEIP